MVFSLHITTGNNFSAGWRLSSMMSPQLAQQQGTDEPSLISAGKWVPNRHNNIYMGTYELADEVDKLKKKELARPNRWMPRSTQYQMSKSSYPNQHQHLTNTSMDTLTNQYAQINTDKYKSTSHIQSKFKYTLSSASRGRWTGRRKRGSTNLDSGV